WARLPSFSRLIPRWEPCGRSSSSSRRSERRGGSSSINSGSTTDADPSTSSTCRRAPVTRGMVIALLHAGHRPCLPPTSSWTFNSVPHFGHVKLIAMRGTPVQWDCLCSVRRAFGRGRFQTGAPSSRMPQASLPELHPFQFLDCKSLGDGVHYFSARTVRCLLRGRYCPSEAVPLRELAIGTPSGSRRPPPPMSRLPQY